jgi:hypothetical protein
MSRFLVVSAMPPLQGITTLAQLKPGGQVLVSCVFEIWYQPSPDGIPLPELEAIGKVAAEAADDGADVFPAASNADTL